MVSILSESKISKTFHQRSFVSKYEKGRSFHSALHYCSFKADNPSLCNTLAETAEDHRRLSPGCISAGRQCSGTGAINQPLGIGPLKRLHCIGADRAKISISAQVGSGRCVIALLLSKPIQDGRQLLTGNDVIGAKSTVAIAAHNSFAGGPADGFP